MLRWLTFPNQYRNRGHGFFPAMSREPVSATGTLPWPRFCYWRVINAETSYPICRV